MRADADWHHTWRWTEIIEGQPDVFILVLEGAPVAIWCSTKAAPITLPDGKYYRLDFIEVRPDLRGGALGPFALALVATRAIELGAQAIVLSAFPVPALVESYCRAGAVERHPKGWNQPAQLVALVFGAAAAAQLKDFADDLLEER